MSPDDHRLGSEWLFTVFTPTYNRADRLSRVYRSLASQTFRSFEWLIVDDGSRDATGKLVAGWQREAAFRIRYIRQGHAGKHVAFNRAVREACGELFLEIDSDDECAPEALERFRFHWESIPAGERSVFTGVCCLCRDAAGQLVGDRFPFDRTDSNCLEMEFRYQVKGEKWGFHRTAVLREFLFPGSEMPFVPEALVWSAIGRKYKTRYINETLRVYWTREGGSADQLTRLNNWRILSPGRAEYYQTLLNRDLDWLPHAPLSFLKVAAGYIRHSLHLGRSLREQLARLKPRAARFLWLLGTPVGVLAYLVDQLRGGAGTLRSERRPVRFLLSRVLWLTRLCRFLTVSKPGFRLCFHPSSVSAMHWVSQDAGRGDEEFFRAFLKPGDMVVDVGANIGTLTLTAAVCVGKEGRVCSIEPHPRIFRYLEANIALNGFINITPFNCAIGRERGEVWISDRRADDMNQICQSGTGLRVKMRTLDELFGGIGRLTLLKIDVEPYEREVLRGGGRLLDRTDCVYCEAWEHESTEEDAIAILRTSGFTVCIVQDGGLTELDQGERPPTSPCNVVAVRDPQQFERRTGWAVRRRGSLS